MAFTNIPSIMGPQDLVQLYGQVNRLIGELENLVGSGGGGTGTSQITTSISSAELKMLQSSPKILVPAPGAGMLNSIVSYVIIYNFGTVQYESETNLNVSINFVGGDNITSVNNLFSAAESSFACDSNRFLGVVGSATNAAISMGSTADFTAGDGTAVAIIDYLTLDVS